MQEYKYNEYYLVMRKKEILSLAATWMELEGIVLSEVSQREKEEHSTISFTCGILQSQTHGNSRMLVARCCGLGK